MFQKLSDYIFAPGERPRDPRERLKHIETIGAKACGLALLPASWTPHFLVLSAELYSAWHKAGPAERKGLLLSALSGLERHLAGWSSRWPTGLAFRSSAISETLGDRGAHQSIELAADYGIERMSAAVGRIYESYEQLRAGGAIAVIVQARVSNQTMGHLSNERRVSKTINHWMWELEGDAGGVGRFNSQRATPPDLERALELSAQNQSAMVELFRRVGRWCSQLGVGRTHLEWGIVGKEVWLFQLDVEDDQPDDGIDPNTFLRTPDTQPAGRPLPGSPFRIAAFEAETGWPKLDHVRAFLVDRAVPYPPLHYAVGTDVQASLDAGFDLVADIRAITHDHAVCRTECVAASVERLNLPRTDTVSAQQAASFMQSALARLVAKGAAAREVCFILHKFIPATAAAWALADPARQLVLVDALWGLPDGLQYLSHDSFEYDVVLHALSSEKPGYKPLFLQETESGEWKLVHVARKLARHRCLSVADIREIAEFTHATSVRLGRSIQIMWFCGIDAKARIGRNIPWYMQNPADSKPRENPQIAPGLPRAVVRTADDLANIPSGKCVLSLEPDVEQFRNEVFLDEVASVALARQLPVIIAGSTLGHAFYTLERKGVSVVGTESSRTRVRQRQVFRKLVRDEIPERIAARGERVTVANIAKSESRVALVVKLYEEAQELLAAETPDDVTAELADILEVVRALCQATGVELSRVEQVADAKRGARGSFVRNVVLLETSWPTWKEKIQSGSAETIPLRELAHVVNRGKAHTANMVATVGGNVAIVELTDGKRLAVKVTAKGVEVAELDGAVVPPAQMTFDFNK